MKASEKIVPIATARDFAVSCCKFFGFLSGLNGLFWFFSDFGKFTPPSEGIFLERLLYFLVAEPGPTSYFFVISPFVYQSLMVVVMPAASPYCFWSVFPEQRFREIVGL